MRNVILRPELIWWYSTLLNRKGWRLLAQFLVRINYILFKADLPAECRISRDVKLFHRGLGVVINPQVTIHRGVRIVHNVTIGVVAGPAGEGAGSVLIEEDVRIGVGAVILASPGKRLVLGKGCQVGAMAYVRDDVAPGDVVMAPVARSRNLSTSQG